MLRFYSGPDVNRQLTQANLSWSSPVVKLVQSCSPTLPGPVYQWPGVRAWKRSQLQNILTRCKWTTVSIWQKPGPNQMAKRNWKDIAVAAFLIFAGRLCSWRDIVPPGGGGDISNWLHDTLQWKQLSEKLNQRGLAPPALPLIYKSAGWQTRHIAWNPATSTTTMNVSDISIFSDDRFLFSDNKW